MPISGMNGPFGRAIYGAGRASGAAASFAGGFRGLMGSGRAYSAGRAVGDVVGRSSGAVGAARGAASSVADHVARGAFTGAGGIDAGVSGARDLGGRIAGSRTGRAARFMGRNARRHPYIAGGAALGAYGAYQYNSSGRDGLRGRSSGGF